MNVTLCSAFRNASRYVERYHRQVIDLARALHARDDWLDCIWCEGDSTDDTFAAIQRAILDEDVVGTPYGIMLFEHSHGGPDHGSVVNAERFANMAKVWNEIWARIPQDAGAVLFVEADLIWEPETMLALFDDLEHVPAVAPLIILDRNGWPREFFYDNWGFWRNGVQIAVMPPYFADLDEDSDLLELDSAGSCIAMRGDVARRVTWPPEDVVKGVCRQIRAGGDCICLDAKQKVIHP